MANIAILDTGYIRTDQSGTQVSGTGSIANSGSAIELKGVSLSFDQKCNVDVTEIVSVNTTGNYAQGPVAGYGTITAGKVTIQGVLDSNSDTDMDLMKEIKNMLRTFGVKLLYYTSTTDGYRDITDSIGATDIIHLSGTTPHLHVRFTSFQISQTADSHLRYTLEAVTTE